MSLKFKHPGSLKSKSNYLAKFLSSPLFLSTIATVIIIYGLPPIFNKYSLELIDNKSKAPGIYYYYNDLDNDGKSEKILFGHFKVDYFNLFVYKNEKIVEQWNFYGQIVKGVFPLISNVRNDSLKLIYFIVYKDSGLYLSGINPLENKFVTREKFIDYYKPVTSEVDVSFSPLLDYDSNNDGINEFYFILDAGFAIQPRRICKYDPASDSIYLSPKSYASLIHSTIFNTFNNKLKFYTYSAAVGNSKSEDPFSDMYAWLINIDQDLKLISKPEKRGYYPSYSQIIQIKNNRKSLFALLNIYTGTENNPCRLSIVDENMREIKSISFNYSSEWSSANLYSEPGENCFYLIKKDGLIQKYDDKLNEIDNYYIPPTTEGYFYSFDVDGDSKKEHLLISQNFKDLIIAQNDFSEYSVITLQGVDAYQTLSLKKNGENKDTFVLTTLDNEYELNYHENAMFYLRYPIYIGIYSVVFLFFLLLEKVQKHRAELKYKTEKDIAELQLKAIKNQIDPHFTLNIINSIGSLSYKEDKDKADYIFGKYSKLLRSTILNSDKIVTTLQEEIDYVENYLELEKYRNGNSFDWKVEIDENVNQNIKIPKMLIHTFVENAIKHGLKTLKENGRLDIVIYKENDNYNLTIKDNGIGRNKAREIESGNTRKGLNIIDQILELYYSLMKKRLTYKIDDLTDDNGIGMGTLVEIKIPID